MAKKAADVYVMSVLVHRDIQRAGNLASLMRSMSTNFASTNAGQASF